MKMNLKNHNKHHIVGEKLLLVVHLNVQPIYRFVYIAKSVRISG